MKRAFSIWSWSGKWKFRNFAITQFRNSYFAIPIWRKIYVSEPFTLSQNQNHFPVTNTLVLNRSGGAGCFYFPNPSLVQAVTTAAVHSRPRFRHEARRP